MPARVVEAQLVLSGKDAGASKAVADIVKQFEELEKASKVSKDVEKVAKSLLEVDKAQKAVNAAMGAQKGAAAAAKNLEQARTAAQGTAQALTEAKAAAAAFEGVKAKRGSEIAQQMRDATKAVREAERAHAGAEKAIRSTARAVEDQNRVLRDAEAAAKAFGAPLNALEKHERSLKTQIDATTDALRRQMKAEDEAGRHADRLASRRAIRREAVKTVAGAAGVAAASKGKQIGLAAVDSVAEYDIALRKQRVFTDIGEKEQAPLIAQQKRVGQETQFSNIDVAKAQTAAMQGLPAGFSPALKAQVAEGIVENVRNFATLMETDLKEGRRRSAATFNRPGRTSRPKRKPSPRPTRRRTSSSRWRSSAA